MKRSLALSMDILLNSDLIGGNKTHESVPIDEEKGNDKSPEQVEDTKKEN